MVQRPAASAAEADNCWSGDRADVSDTGRIEWIYKHPFYIGLLVFDPYGYDRKDLAMARDERVQPQNVPTDSETMRSDP